jgi:hypothetical protein
VAVVVTGVLVLVVAYFLDNRGLGGVHQRLSARSSDPD